ncbi:MAG: L-dopachrome tautomerase-related protein [Janthinobacterium lividum]
MKLLALPCLLSLAFSPTAQAQAAATDQPTGHLETVATFPGPMPEGVTVSHTGRIFVNFARWGDDIPFTVAELVHGKAVAFPNQTINNWPGRKLPNPNAFLDANADQTHFVSVQSVVVDPDDRLWVLDTGAPLLKNIVPEGPKLVAIDLHTNQIVKTILIPPETCGTNCYLNDVRFDLRNGDAGPQLCTTMVGSHPAPNPNVPPKDPAHPLAERACAPGTQPSDNLHGTAYITDSSSEGPNAIIVVDLGTGKSWRRLNQHSSTLSEDQFLMFAEGRPVYQTLPNQPPKAVNFAADGIAISADGDTLYYCPINGTKLYAVATAMLRDRSKSDAQVAGTVRIVTGKMPSDGLESDAAGNVYMTDPVTDSIHRWNPNTGLTETLAHDPRILWPDTMSVATDGFLYFTSNQLHRQPTMHNGEDLRQKPYQLFRLKIDQQPVLLK